MMDEIYTIYGSNLQPLDTKKMVSSVKVNTIKDGIDTFKLFATKIWNIVSNNYLPISKSLQST